VTALRVHRVLEHTIAEGPGPRACVWVQGCSIRCPGCFNPHTWDAGGGHAMEAEILGEHLAGLTGIQGVTFLGGEPFDQAAPLAIVGERVRAAGGSVMTFTGHTFERLQAATESHWQRLLATTDLLVDGPFDWRRPDHARPWVGSTNQRFWFLTDRYAHLDLRADVLPDRVEVHLHPDGRVLVNGMARREVLAGLRRAITARETVNGEGGDGRPSR
jgi:anaerobic ribonucleoside-triphosphate reductase activating protein